MRAVDELRAPTAGRLLTLWRESGKAAEEPVERGVLCNAQILAESCFYQGQPAFPDGESVLEELTPREMEGLLRQLAFGREQGSGAQNPAFDPARFCALEELG